MGKRKTSLGQQRAANANPPAAGLKIFWPTPPNGYLTTTNANIVAAATISNRTDAGSSSGISMPVTKLDWSLIFGMVFPNNEQNIPAITAIIIENAPRYKGLKPKKYTDMAYKGIIAMITSAIIV